MTWRKKRIEKTAMRLVERRNMNATEMWVDGMVGFCVLLPEEYFYSRLKKNNFPTVYESIKLEFHI